MKKVAFVGTGIIGSGLAVNAAMHGYEVAVYYRRNIEKLQRTIKEIFAVFEENHVCTPAEAAQYFAHMTFTTDLKEAVQDAALIQESIAERLDMKQEIYRKIQETCGENTVIASSTTAMFPSVLSKDALYPQKIIVGHPYNPSYLLPLIEVCGGETASEDTVATACEIYRTWGKVPVICQKEIMGFVVNRLSWAATEAAKACIQEGVCTVEDIDKAIMYGPGMRMAITGQLLTMSLGVDGGFRKMAEKYGAEPSEWDEVYAQGVEKEIANRSEAMGNTEESVKKFRDKACITLLKLQNLL